MKPTSITCDVVKLMPPLTWLVVCIVAIPSYARLGWVTPVVCAVYSAIVSILATYDIFVYQSKTLHEYIPLMAAGDSDNTSLEDAEAAESSPINTPSQTKWMFTKLVISMISSIITVALTILFLVVAFTVIDPEKHNIPCDGACEGCAEEPNCSQWIADVEKEYPITNICPPTKASADTDATFSCKADGFWMIVTAVITMGWLWAMFLAYESRRERNDIALVQETTSNMNKSQGEESSVGVL